MRKRKAYYKALKGVLSALEEPLQLDPERAERAERKAEQRALSRQREIPRDRCCPTCRRTVLESNRWVVGDEVLCRSCAQVPPPPEGWKPNADAIVRIGRWRVQRGTALAFADLPAWSNWSPSKWSKIKSGAQTIDDDELSVVRWAAEMSQKALELTDCSYWYDTGQQLEMFRRLAGLSVRVLAERLGWHHDRLRRVESGCVLQGVDLAAIFSKLTDLTD